MAKQCYLFVLLLVFSTVRTTVGQVSIKPVKGYFPPDGFVPTAETAIAVAEAVLKPVYSREQIESERPFKAVLKANVWVVTGAVPCIDPPPGALCPGGAAEVRISKKTGQIVFMTHYQ